MYSRILGQFSAHLMSATSRLAFICMHACSSWRTPYILFSISVAVAVPQLLVLRTWVGWNVSWDRFPAPPGATRPTSIRTSSNSHCCLCLKQHVRQSIHDLRGWICVTALLLSMCFRYLTNEARVTACRTGGDKDTSLWCRKLFFTWTWLFWHKKIANHCVLLQLCGLGPMAVSIQNYIFLNFMNQWYLVELHGWVISQPQSLYLRRIIQHRNTKTNIHAWSGIRTHDPINQVAKTYALARVATGTRPLGSCYLKIPCLGPPFPAFRLK
jgi:hypothetical protein